MVSTGEYLLDEGYISSISEYAPTKSETLEKMIEMLDHI